MHGSLLLSCMIMVGFNECHFGQWMSLGQSHADLLKITIHCTMIKIRRLSIGEKHVVYPFILDHCICVYLALFAYSKLYDYSLH